MQIRVSSGNSAMLAEPHASWDLADSIIWQSGKLSVRGEQCMVRLVGAFRSNAPLHKQGSVSSDFSIHSGHHYLSEER